MVEHKVVNMKKSRKDGMTVALVDRATSFQPFIVAWAYDTESREWGQGHYFNDYDSAIKFYNTNY